MWTSTFYSSCVYRLALILYFYNGNGKSANSSDELYREARSWTGNKPIPAFELETLMAALAFSPAEILKFQLQGPGW